MSRAAQTMRRQARKNRDAARAAQYRVTQRKEREALEARLAQHRVNQERWSECPYSGLEGEVDVIFYLEDTDKFLHLLRQPGYWDLFCSYCNETWPYRVHP